MMKNTTVKTLLIILTGLFLLGACGQKGPLFLEESGQDVAAEAVPGSVSESSDEQTDAESAETAVKE